MDDTCDQHDASESYQIKTFGSSRDKCRFHRLPTVIQRANDALLQEEIMAFWPVHWRGKGG